MVDKDSISDLTMRSITHHPVGTRRACAAFAKRTLQPLLEDQFINGMRKTHVRFNRSSRLNSKRHAQSTRSARAHPSRSAHRQLLQFAIAAANCHRIAVCPSFQYSGGSGTERGLRPRIVDLTVVAPRSSHCVGRHILTTPRVGVERPPPAVLFDTR